jgi:signal recognition particle subunit SRP54
MAQRILGQGDIATLLETAQKVLDEEEMQRQQQKMLEGKFSLDDFLKAMAQIKRLGSMKNLLKMIPGMGQLGQAMDALDGMDPDKDFGRVQAMIQSMTQDERRNPDKIDRSRRNRISQGSGTDPADVHDLLKQFKGMSGMMQQMAGLGMGERMRAMRDIPAMMQPGAELRADKQRSKRGPADKNLLRDKKKQQRKQAKDQRKKNKKRR